MDRPLLVRTTPRLEFDINDVDGQMSMIDRELSGTVQLAFTQPMNPEVPGTVHIDGEPAEYVLKPFTVGDRQTWVLAIKVFGRLTDYGRTHLLQVDGFASSQGLAMEPAEMSVTTRAQAQPLAHFALHERLAQHVAEDGIVLLKNDNAVLPLTQPTLNIFGSALQSFRTTVVGAGKINPRYTVGLREAIESDARFSLNLELAEFHRAAGDAIPADDILRRAKAAEDLGIVILSRNSGENMDNSSDPGEFYLSEAEDDLIRIVAESFERSLVILNTPYPIDVRFAEKYGIDALVLAGVGGMLAGPALLNVLHGTVTPSGRLPDTWALDLTDIPAHKNFYDFAGGKPRYTGDSEVWIDTVYEESIYVGYRYFSSFDVRVAYPFGHGLSYTSFDGAPGEVLVGESIEFDVTVTNSGGTRGREVVQVYLSKPDDELEQPRRELLDFAKTGVLHPGESETVAFRIPLTRLATYDDRAGQTVVLAGDYSLQLGQSAQETTEFGRFTIDDRRIIRSADARLLAREPIRALSRREGADSYPRGDRSGVREGATGHEPERDVDQFLESFGRPIATTRGTTVTFAELQADPDRAAEFTAQLSVGQLARLTVCAQSGWGMEGTGVAGILARPEGLDIPYFQVADGNSGVNVREPNIGLPTTVVLASTFDKGLAEDFGRVLGEEASAFDINLILAPGFNLHRHPLNGRHPEYMSEDPVLAGIMAGHYARGLESTGVGACYKHFAANNAESARKRNQSVIPERALRDLYLKAFEVALTVHHPKSVMTAYNAINGRATSTDPELLEGVLRGEWGFRGMIMTDWNSNDTAEVVDMVAGGNNWITPGSPGEELTAPIVAAVASGRLSLERLRVSVSHLLRAVAELTA